MIEDGDIDEYYRGEWANLFSVYTEANAIDGNWHIRADFRTHSNPESWDVDLLCAAIKGAEPFVRNSSRFGKGLRDCGGDHYRCQVMEGELSDRTGQVRIVGGGISGNPTGWNSRCPTADHVEVYIDDRDPVTNDPQWSRPSLCVSKGQTFYKDPNRTYDLRSRSVSGAEPIAFQLVSAYAPTLTKAAPVDFPAPYGPGMRLEWTPSADSRAAYYEIQYAPLGSDWKVYTNARSVAHGGWINHHGTIAYGSITKALPPGQAYLYRVRVLDSSKRALTGWSNTLVGTVRDWNKAPWFNSIRHQTAIPGQVLFFDVVATDPEGMDLTLEVLGLPPGASFAPGTTSGGLASGRVGFMPSPWQAGSYYEARFRATDPLGLKKEITVTISVCTGSGIDCLW